MTKEYEKQHNEKMKTERKERQRTYTQMVNHSRNCVADELFDYGFILSQIGPPSNPNWALYYESNSLYKVIDILDGVNFYDLFLVNMGTGEEQLVFSKVHLLEDEMEERLSELIGIDLESKQQGIPVFSKYIQ